MTVNPAARGARLSAMNRWTIRQRTAMQSMMTFRSPLLVVTAWMLLLIAPTCLAQSQWTFELARGATGGGWEPVLLFASPLDAQSPGGSAVARTMKSPVALTPASITAGAAAYQKYCAFCHGADAKGNGPLAPKDSNPPDLTDATWTHGSTDAQIFTVIANGTGPNSKMAGFKGKMPDQDLWNIINYLRSLGPKTGARS